MLPCPVVPLAVLSPDGSDRRLLTASGCLELPFFRDPVTETSHSQTISYSLSSSPVGRPVTWTFRAPTASSIPCISPLV